MIASKGRLLNDLSMREPDLCHHFPEQSHQKYSFASNDDVVPAHTREAWRLNTDHERGSGLLAQWALKCPWVDESSAHWLLNCWQCPTTQIQQDLGGPQFGHGPSHRLVLIKLELKNSEELRIDDPIYLNSRAMQPFLSCVVELEGINDEDAILVTRECVSACVNGTLAPSGSGCQSEWKKAADAALARLFEIT